MQRLAMNYLIEWKDKKDRKPLLLYGARQVGKTYLVKQFGDQYFKDIIYVNFETNDIIGKIFDENISPEYIIKNLVTFLFPVFTIKDISSFFLIIYSLFIISPS